MKRMKLRQVLQSGRATVAALAGTAMVVGGAGAGTAALALGHSAGALSLQAPAIAVREQNVNSAGRIRVALPSGGVGVNGTVSVSNFPKTQPVSGTVNVGNLPSTSAGTSHLASAFFTVTGNPTTLLNVSGNGVFKGIGIGDNLSGNGCNASLTLVITIDGQNVFSDGAPLAAGWFGSTSYLSSAVNNQGGWGMQFWPSGGLPFHQSLVVKAYDGCGISMNTVSRIWYTTGG